MAVHQIM